MYKLLLNDISEQPCGAIRFNADGSTTSFMADPANTDYQAYLKWLEEGNQPLPAEE